MDRDEEMQRLISEYREIPVPQEACGRIQEAIARGKKHVAKRQRTVFVSAAASCAAAAVLALILFGVTGRKSDGGDSGPDMAGAGENVLLSERSTGDAGEPAGFSGGMFENAAPADGYLYDTGAAGPGSGDTGDMPPEDISGGLESPSPREMPDTADDITPVTEEDMLPATETAMEASGMSSEEYTELLLEKFEQEMTQKGTRAGRDVSYEVLADNDEWFTLMVCAKAESEDGHELRKYYNVDKRSEMIVNLGDLYNGTDYISVISDEIIRQMHAAMEQGAVSYAVGGSGAEGGFSQIRADQNYYFNADGNLVIVFDEYEVTPDAGGCPEFVINRELLE